MGVGKAGEYQFKEQTDKHKKAMKRVAEELFDNGLTPDEIIDVGDYLLNEMSLAELTGEKSNDKEKDTSKQQGKESTGKNAPKSSKSKKGDKKPRKDDKTGGKGKPKQDKTKKTKPSKKGKDKK